MEKLLRVLQRNYEYFNLNVLVVRGVVGRYSVPPGSLQGFFFMIAAKMCCENYFFFYPTRILGLLKLQ